MSKRYRRKGRTSSPTRSVVDGVDFDQPHAALTGANVEKPKAGISTMKGKAGKKMSVEKLASEKSEGVSNRTIEEHALAHTATKQTAFTEPKTTRYSEVIIIRSNSEPDITLSVETDDQPRTSRPRYQADPSFSTSRKYSSRVRNI